MLLGADAFFFGLFWTEQALHKSYVALLNSLKTPLKQEAAKKQAQGTDDPAALIAAAAADLYEVRR